MPETPLLYYITDRTVFPGDEPTRCRSLLDKISEAAIQGVDYIQLREKDLPARQLESLAREAMRIIRTTKLRTRNPQRTTTALFINSRIDVALSTGADGVHLRSRDVSAEDVRIAWQRARALARDVPRPDPLIAVSCHSPQQVVKAATGRAAFAVFAPVFEKRDARGAIPAGLEALSQACRAKISVLALGGVTLENAESCLRVGAAGIAAVRLFQENDIATIVRRLRGS